MRDDTAFNKTTEMTIPILGNVYQFLPFFLIVIIFGV